MTCERCPKGGGMCDACQERDYLERCCAMDGEFAGPTGHHSLWCPFIADYLEELRHTRGGR